MLRRESTRLGLLDEGLRGQRRTGAQGDHGQQIGQHEPVRLLLGLGHHRVDGEERPRLGVRVGGDVVVPVQRQRLGRALAGEVVGEDVRQALLRGQSGREVGGAEQPHGRRADRVRGRVQRVQPAAHVEPRATGRHHRDDVVDVRREVVGRVGLDATAAVPQRPGGHRVGAGCPAQAQVDAAGVGGLEEGELLGDDQRGMVGQHHAARADPDALGGGGHHRDQHGRVGRRDGRHVVVLGQPVPAGSRARRPCAPGCAWRPRRRPSSGRSGRAPGRARRARERSPRLNLDPWPAVPPGRGSTRRPRADRRRGRPGGRRSPRPRRATRR